MASSASPISGSGTGQTSAMTTDHISSDTAAIEVRNRGLLTVAVMMASIMQILDTTIANVALPHMQTSLGATADTVTWVLTSYILATAIAIPITGWLSDRLGMRLLFIGAVIAFTISSMLCGIATNLPEMVLFRCLQGVSAAFIGPLSQTVLLDINKPSQHAKAMSIWGMGVMIGPIFGPVLGGWLTENFSWRWVFYVNVPVGIITVIMLLALLPHKDTRKRKFDLFGFSMLALSLASLQLMLDRGHQLDWFDSAEIWIECGVSIATLWIFIVHSIIAKNPMFDRRLFKDRNLVSALLFMLVIGLIMFATTALIPPMLQHVYGYPVLDAGLLMMPRGIGVLLSMWVAGQMVNRIDPRYLMVTGALISAYSLHMMSGWSLEMDWRPFATSGFVQGLGMGLIFIPLTTLAFATLPPQFRTDASSLVNLFRSIGASISISILTALLARNTQVSHTDLSSHITDSSITAFDPSTFQRFGGYADSLYQMINGEVSRQAVMIAYIDDYYLMMFICLVAIPLLLLLKRPKGPLEKVTVGE